MNVSRYSLVLLAAVGAGISPAWAGHGGHGGGCGGLAAGYGCTGGWAPVSHGCWGGSYASGWYPVGSGCWGSGWYPASAGCTGGWHSSGWTSAGYGCCGGSWSSGWYPVGQGCWGSGSYPASAGCTGGWHTAGWTPAGSGCSGGAYTSGWYPVGDDWDDEVPAGWSGDEETVPSVPAPPQPARPRRAEDRAREVLRARPAEVGRPAGAEPTPERIGLPEEENNGPTPAKLVVSLPPGAKLKINGTVSRAGGETRTFVSPPLKRDRSYHYTLQAELDRNGKTLAASKRVAVRAGEEKQVKLEFADVVAPE